MPTLEPPLLTETQTFYSPTLKHVLKPGLLTNAQSFPAATITQGAYPASSGSRIRQLAFLPRLDLAIRATPALRPRARLKTVPRVFVEKARDERATSIADLSSVDSTSFATQTAYQQAPTENPRVPVYTLDNR